MRVYYTVDGVWGFGFKTLREAVARALKKAKSSDTPIDVFQHRGGREKSVRIAFPDGYVVMSKNYY